MENATMQDLIDAGYNQIGYTGEDGQGQITIMAMPKGKGQWAYLLVQQTDDGEILEIIGLAKGKVVTSEKLW